MQRVVILSDHQGNKVDRKAWKATQNFLDDFTPDSIILAGDIVEFSDVSSYRKDPNRRMRLDREARFVREYILSPLDSEGVIPVFYLEGNHEDRLHRYLCDKAPELYGSMLTVPELLRTSEYGVEYLGKKPLWLNKHLVVVHGHLIRKWSGYTARAIMNEFKCSVIHGHSHRMGMYYESGANREWVGIENGHLSDPKQAGYVHGVANWQQGFTVVYLHKNNQFHCEQAHIWKGRVYYGGRIWAS